MTGDKYDNIRKYSIGIRKEKLNFNSEYIKPASNYYVGWVDLMGAGHTMTTSVQKSANFLARLHMSVAQSMHEVQFDGEILAINDGVFIISKSKIDIQSIIGRILILLSANFIAIPRPHDRFLLRGAIAYGPVYFGDQIIQGVIPKKMRTKVEGFLDRVMFGPALIQAYQAESKAPPYGIAIHETARAFCPDGETPFRLTHWPWWAPNEEVKYPKSLPPMTTFKDCLSKELDAHFTWMKDTAIFHSLDAAKIDHWRRICGEYYKIG